MLSLDDIEMVAAPKPPYAFGHVPAWSVPAPSPPVFPDHVRPGVSA
jgi:hypothetical protein